MTREEIDKVVKEIREHCRNNCCRSCEAYTVDGCVFMSSYPNEWVYRKAESEEQDMDEIDFIQPKKTVGKLISVDVFDKMKDEFISRYPKNSAGELEMNGTFCVFSLKEILYIIDKYMAESEDKG